MFVSEPNQRSSGGNTLSSPKVSVSILQPIFNGQTNAPAQWESISSRPPWSAPKYATINFYNSIYAVDELCAPLIAWASCQIRKITGVHAPRMPGTFSPPPRVSDPDMHHDTCVTHVPWCMPGSLTSGFLWSRRRGKTFPAFPTHAQPAILRIW